MEDTQVLGEFKDKQVLISNHEPAKKEQLKACLEELARFLEKSQIADLEGIEKTVRSQILELVRIVD